MPRTKPFVTAVRYLWQRWVIVILLESHFAFLNHFLLLFIEIVVRTIIRFSFEVKIVLLESLTHRLILVFRLTTAKTITSIYSFDTVLIGLNIDQAIIHLTLLVEM